MESSHKVIAVVIIWAIVLGVAAATLQPLAASVSQEWVLVAIMGIFATLGLGVTFMIGSLIPTVTKGESNAVQTRGGKAKNEDMNLAERLIASMSDDEIEALRRRLNDTVGDDGELVSVDERLRQQQRR